MLPAEFTLTSIPQCFLFIKSCRNMVIVSKEGIYMCMSVHPRVEIAVVERKHPMPNDIAYQPIIRLHLIMVDFYVNPKLEQRTRFCSQFSDALDSDCGTEFPVDYVRLILTAPVYDVAIQTPLQMAHKLSASMKCNVLLKREDTQPIFSFKIRGAYNKIKSLTLLERQRGVIAVSAGNHAQGVALASRKLKIQATIVMPVSTPLIKVESVRRLGSNVVLFGDDFDEAKVECARLMKEFGFVNIPPYDDPLVIAGQGTVAMEIMRQLGTWRFINLDFIDRPNESI